MALEFTNVSPVKKYGHAVDFTINTSNFLRHMVGVKRHVRDLAFVGVEDAMFYAKETMKWNLEDTGERSGKEWTLYFGDKKMGKDRPKVTWTASAWGTDPPEAPAHFHAIAAAQGVSLKYPSIADSFDAGAEFKPGHIWVVGWIRNDAPHAGIIEYGGETNWGVIMPRHYMESVMKDPHHVGIMIGKVATALGRYSDRMVK